MHCAAKTISLLALLLTGCTTRTVVVSADEYVFPLNPGQTFTASNKVWIVPERRFIEMVNKLRQ